MSAAVPESPKLVDPPPGVLEVFTHRWSPYAYDPRPIDRAAFSTCLEAGRWAASSYNEQPWAFILAYREEAARFETLLSCLLEANQAWARNASVLMLGITSKFFSKNGSLNRVAPHDLGQFAANLATQATHVGLHVHQMAGVNLSRARQVYEIPDSHDPYTAIAVGYAARSSDKASEELFQRDRATRQRKPIETFVFADKFGQSAMPRG